MSDAQPSAALREPVASDSGSSDLATSARRRLMAARGFVFDMDGVLYRGNTLLPGVVDALNALTLRDRGYVLATNNSMATPTEYVAKLATMGVTVDEAVIQTSGIATRDYLTEILPPGSGIFVVGMPGLREQLFGDSPFHPVQYEEEQPAAVVVGLDLGFTYEKLKVASTAIRAGARFIATNTDATLPTEQGLVPGAGSIAAAVATASGQVPTVVGKPEPLVMTMALEQLGVTPAEAVMIGDRLETDIVAGHRAGMLTVLVLTGVSTREEIPHAAVMPDLVFTDLTALVETLVGNA